MFKDRVSRYIFWAYVSFFVVAVITLANAPKSVPSVKVPAPLDTTLISPEHAINDYVDIYHHKLGDGHDYLIARQYHGVCTIHAAGCRKCATLNK